MKFITSLTIEILSRPPVSVYFKGFTSFDVWAQKWALKRSDKFSAAEWVFLQEKKFRSIAKAARSNTPYWSGVFKSAGLLDEDDLSLAQLFLLPISSRQSLKKLNVEEISDLSLNDRSSEASTSGSTSEPFFFLQDDQDLFRRNINTTQELRYAGVDARSLIVVIGLENHLDLKNLGKFFSVADFENEEIRRQKIYPYLKDNNPVLITSASTVRRLVDLANYDHEKIKLDYVFYRGEHISKEEKMYISEELNCKLYTTYGSRECGLLGIECEYNNLHTAPWMNHVEILNEEGLPTRKGMEGDIVVTHFDNFVMPFIRYSIGDRGSLLKSECPCGRKNDLINFSGRTKQSIILPNGVDIPLLNITRKLDEEYSQYISKYQFHLKENMIEIWLVPNESLMSDTQVEEIVEHTTKMLQNFYKVTVKNMEQLQKNKDDKTPLLFVE